MARKTYTNGTETIIVDTKGDLVGYVNHGLLQKPK